MDSHLVLSKKYSTVCYSFVAISQKVIFALALCFASLAAFAQDSITCSACTTSDVQLYGNTYLCEHCLWTISQKQHQIIAKETELSFMLQQTAGALANAGNTLYTRIKKTCSTSFKDLNNDNLEDLQTYKLEAAKIMVCLSTVVLCPFVFIPMSVGYLTAKGLDIHEQYQSLSAHTEPVHLIVKPILQQVEKQLSAYSPLSAQTDVLLQSLKSALEELNEANRMTMSLVLLMLWSQAPQEALMESTLTNDIVTGLRGMTKFPDDADQLNALLKEQKTHLTLQTYNDEQNPPWNDISHSHDSETLLAFIENNLKSNDTVLLSIAPVGIIGIHKTHDNAYYIYNTITGSQFSIAESSNESPLSLPFYLKKCIETINNASGNTELKYNLFPSLDHSKQS
ncbi:hypothetical protein N9V90_02245 [Endozoicomonas sp.]|nr:hypothetical protein [Endozoicomonas sp.]